MLVPQALRSLVHGVLLLLLVLGLALPAWATDLKVEGVVLEPCPSTDVGHQPSDRPRAAARCLALRGVVLNPGRRPVVDTDLFAVIVDASGEPVLQNRSRVGSIGDIPPGRSTFALRLAVPAGSPEELQVRQVKARGFSAPVRTRAAEGDELLPLEQALEAG